MAELLIKLSSHVHPDAKVDASGAYKRGDLVVVQEDGHAWGKKEGPPRFVILKIPGVSAARVRAYCAEHRELDPFTGREAVTRRRRWRLRVDDVPLAVRNALRDTGMVTLTWDQVRPYVQDKVTLLSAPVLSAETLR